MQKKARFRVCPSAAPWTSDGASGERQQLATVGDRRLTLPCRHVRIGSNPAQIGPARLGTLQRQQQSWRRDDRRSGQEVTLLAGSCQLVEQRLGVLQVGGVEALGEPAVDRREQVVSLSTSALVAPEAG